MQELVTYCDCNFPDVGIKCSARDYLKNFYEAFGFKVHGEAQEPQFQRENICIREIKNASHFAWIDNPDQVKQVFVEYCQWLESS